MTAKLCLNKVKMGRLIQLSILVLVFWTCCHSAVAQVHKSSEVVLNKCCENGFRYDASTFSCASHFEGTGLSQESELEFVSKLTNTSGSQNIGFSANYESVTPHGELSHTILNTLTLNQTLTLPLERGDSSIDFVDFKVHVNFPTKDVCANGSFLLWLNISSEDVSTRITRNGYLQNGSQYYSQAEYCIARIEETAILFHVCHATCSETAPCIKKCCPPDEVWNQVHGIKIPGVKQRCVPSGDQVWHPDFYETGTRHASDDRISRIFPHYLVSHPREWCQRDVYIPFTITQQDKRGNPFAKFRIKLNGQVIRREHRYKWNDTEVEQAYYCVDGGINPPHYLSAGINETVYSGLHSQHSIIFECGPFDKEVDVTARSTLYGGAMIVSCVFLVITLLVYCLLWEKQNVHGWTQMSYTTSLLFFYFFLVLMHFSPFFLEQTMDDTPTKTCFFIAVGVHFTFLSTFCWMTMVNFDLWCTFRSLKPTGGRSKGLLRFLGYAAFSVGGAVITVSIACVLQAEYGDNYESGIIVPEYGLRRCHLDDKAAQLVYAYGPAGILLLINALFFVVTVHALHKIRQSTKIASDSSSKNEKQKQSVKLFGKLLFVMGFPWIFEIISWFVERSNPWTGWWWTIFDLINIFQAVAIFYIFVCKKDILHSLCQKYPRFRAIIDHILLEPETATRLSQEYPLLKCLFKWLTNGGSEATSATDRGTNTESVSFSSSAHGSATTKKDIRMQSRKPSAVEVS